MPALLSTLGLAKFNGAINLSFAFTGSASDLLIATGSVDQAATYVFEVEPRRVAASAAKSVNYWNLNNGNDTMFTLWNPGAQDEDLLVTLYFMGGHYKIPIHLAAGASNAFNISEVIMARQPDSEGNRIPSFIRQGSAVISGMHEETDKINVLVEAGTFNVKTKTCVQNCQTCLGYTDYWATPAPMGLAVGASSQMSAIGQWHTGAQFNVTGSSEWSSNAPSIATVSAGMVQGMAAGSTNIVAMFTTTLEGTACGTLEGPDGNPIGCPIDDMIGDEPPVDVKPTISGLSDVWWFSGESPLGYGVQVTLTSSGGPNTTWSVTSGANLVTLSGTSGGQITVKATGNLVSSATGDITITATANGQASAPFAMTARRPFRLVAGVITPSCDSTFGYSDSLDYTIQDNLLENMPTSVPVNEHWTTAIVVDLQGNNWPRPTEGSFTTLSATPYDFADIITGASGTSAIPQPSCNGVAQKVQHWGQEWHIGTSAIGSGTRVQTDTFTRFTEHAEHNSILTGSGIQP